MSTPTNSPRYTEAYVLDEPVQQVTWSRESSENHINLSNAPTQLKKILDIYTDFINIFCDGHAVRHVRNTSPEARAVTSIEYLKNYNGSWSYTFNVANFVLVLRSLEPQIVLTHQGYEISDFVTVSGNSLKGTSRYKLDQLATEIGDKYQELKREQRLDRIFQENVVTKQTVTDYLYRRFKHEYEGILTILQRVGHLEQDSQRLIKNRVTGYQPLFQNDLSWGYEIMARDMSVVIKPGGDGTLIYLKDTECSLITYIQTKIAILTRIKNVYPTSIDSLSARTAELIKIVIEFESLHDLNPDETSLVTKNKIIRRAFYSNS